jgi:CRISPR/Cas system-associated protein Csx1
MNLRFHQTKLAICTPLFGYIFTRYLSGREGEGDEEVVVITTGALSLYPI